MLLHWYGHHQIVSFSRVMYIICFCVCRHALVENNLTIENNFSVKNEETKSKNYFCYPLILRQWAKDDCKTLGNIFFVLTVFNTHADTMDTCAAEQYCQKFHQNKYLYNESSNMAAECDNCNQWFHCECLSFNPREIEKSATVFSDCHISDLWGTTLWVLQYVVNFSVLYNYR